MAKTRAVLRLASGATFGLYYALGPMLKFGFAVARRLRRLCSSVRVSFWLPSHLRSLQMLLLLPFPLPLPVDTRSRSVADTLRRQQTPTKQLSERCEHETRATRLQLRGTHINYKLMLLGFAISDSSAEPQQSLVASRGAVNFRCCRLSLARTCLGPSNGL